MHGIVAWPLAPDKVSSGLARSDQAKTEIRRSAADFGFAAAANQIPRAVLISAQIRSAAHDPLGRTGFLRVVAVARTLRVVRDRTRPGQHGVIIWPVPVGAPLPDVATHVVEPEPVWWKRRHRRCPGVAVVAAILHRELSLPCVSDGSASRLQLVAPWIAISIEASARGEFEFRFCGQTLAGPLRIGQCILERDVHDRMILAVLNAAAASFRMPPTRAWGVPPPLQRIVERDRM